MSNASFRADIAEIRMKYGEANDCTVKAWAEVFDVTYVYAHYHLAKHGRGYWEGMRYADLELAMNDVSSHVVEKLPYSRSNRVTIAKFLREHPTGRYYIIVKGHALCIKDGIVFDDGNRTNRRQVIGAWKIEKLM